MECNCNISAENRETLKSICLTLTLVFTWGAREIRRTSENWKGKKVQKKKHTEKQIVLELSPQKIPIN